MGLVSYKEVQDRISTAEGNITHIPVLSLSNGMTLGRWLGFPEL